MMALKKAGSFLSIFLVFSVVAVTVPLRVSAEPYTGELQLQNTRVLPDYRAASGYGQATLNALDGAYFPRPGSFSARENNNFISSLPQKTFYASVENDVLNCTGDDINLTANNGILLTYYAPDTGDSGGGDPLCLPLYPTAQNTTTTLTQGGRDGLGSVVQSYYLIPAPLLGEAEQITSVESLPNDPNNVRVTVTDNYTRDGYVIRFTRQGYVERVIGGDHRPWLEDRGFYKDGVTYVVNWISNWVGQIPLSMGDENGTIIWIGQNSLSYDDNGRVVLDPLLVDTGYPTPQISQVEATFISASSSIIRPRNSDVIAVTQPQCTRGGSSGFWSSTVWISCTTYGLSADGRTGTANYFNQQSGRGWFFDLLGIALVVVGLSFGVDFIGIFTGGTGVLAGTTLTQVVASLGGQVGSNLLLNSASPEAVAAVGALAASTLQTIATSPTSLGTVERSNGLGVGSWSWNPSSAPVPVIPVVSGPYISVTSPTTNQTVVQGGTLNISWNSQNAPDDSRVVMWLVNTRTGESRGIVKRNQPTNGSTSWNLPGVGARTECADCGGIQETVPVGTYKIVAKLYTPIGAYFGDTFPPENPIQPTYLASGDSNVFTVTNPAPTITNISPNNAQTGAGFTLTVNGTNFVPSSVINFNGIAKMTSFVSVNQLTASIPASDVSNAGTYSVTVSNPTPGGGTSNPRTLTVTGQPLPSCVFSASPSAIVPPQSSSLSWNCGNASSCSIDNGIGSVGTSGSRTVKPSQTTTYTLSCNGAGGGASFQTTVRTTRFDIREVAP